MPFYRGTRLSLLGKNLISYLLRARFGVPDQGYADAQVLDTKAEGVEVGQLTVVEVDGTLAIVGNECAFTAQGTPTWGDLGLYSQAITKALGWGLLATINLSTWEEMGVGWDDAAAVADPDNMVYALQANATDGQLDVEGGTAVLTGLSTSTDYEVAIVLGGYDSNAVPWRIGQLAASYLYGAAYFYQDGTNWHLLWRKSTDNTATLYATLASLDAVGSLDNFRVPDADLSPVLQPQALSTFDAANGTSLDAITPEVGGGWTEQSGDWDIQGNKAHRGGTGEMATTVDAGIANAIVDASLLMASDDGGTHIGLDIRYTDVDNRWRLIADQGDTWKIYEVNSGATTERASVAVTIDENITYQLRAILDGQEISGFVNGGDKVTYASASFNETETNHGFESFQEGTVSVDSTADNFTIMPRTSAAYDTALGGV